MKRKIGIRLRSFYRRWRKAAAVAVAGGAACAVLVVLIIWHACPFPAERLGRWSISPVVTDRTGRPMLEVVGKDGQWRRPVPLAEMSPWLLKATVAIEDERFYRHCGVDPWAVVRAVEQNVFALRTVSGASTISMQACRMMEDRPRTLGTKLVESFRAMQFERLRSKDEILEWYLNTAPYGGNIRGVEAAARVYFRKHACDLTLGEAALLAGLPQSPNRYRPDRFGERAARRRDYVLARMAELGFIQPEQRELAQAEPVPAHRYSLGRVAPSHAGIMALQRRAAGGCTTIDPVIQADVQSLASRYRPELPAGAQVAAVVIDIADSSIVALAGSRDPSDVREGQVNGVLGRRSPGSALKPFIYAAAIEAGLLDPTTVLYDVPIERGGWTPSDFDRRFVGAISADEALRRSLNVPAILVAEATGLSRCLGTIQAAGIQLPGGVRDRAGLSIVTGATEVSLLDLTNGYATLGRRGVRRLPRLFVDEDAPAAAVLSAEACAVIDDILSTRKRRPHGMEDRDQTSVPWFMWKTGTSSGRRDAWAVGHNRRFAVGVWIGRFAGNGAPQFVGGEAAEPLLALLFDLSALRATDDPPPPVIRVAVNPVAPPPELAEDLRILSPAAESRFIAVDGTATVHVAANRVTGLNWFLNGRLLSGESAERLALSPGRYELRCVDAAGRALARSFQVLPASSGRVQSGKM